MPPNAVIFVFGNDCGQAAMWKKYEHAEGRFIVGAGINKDHDNKLFESGITDKGTIAVQLEERNLPALKLPIPFSTIGIRPEDLGNFQSVVSVGTKSDNPHAINWAAELAIGGHSVPIDTLPPWVALTACQKSR